MPTCERCGDDVDETYTLDFEWPAEDPAVVDDAAAFDDPGAAVLELCGQCADGVASNVLVDRAITRGFESVYAGLYAPPEVRP